MKYSNISAEEKEFLDHYDINQFERPSVAADIVAFAVMQEGQSDNIRKLANRELKILLIKRAQFPYKGAWALPGGFVLPGESVEETAARELFEETNVKNPFLRLSGVYAEKGRDPRGWIISNSFLALINAENCNLRADTDAWDAAWFCVNLVSEKEDSSQDNIVVIKHRLTLSFDSEKSESNIAGSENAVLKATVIEEKTSCGYNYISKFRIGEAEGLAFDHAKIILQSLLNLREMVDADLRVAFDLLPGSFTLAQLQSTIERIKDKELLSGNFRRKVSEYVEETDEIIEGQGHRPAQLFRVKK